MRPTPAWGAGSIGGKVEPSGASLRAPIGGAIGASPALVSVVTCELVRIRRPALAPLPPSAAVAQLEGRAAAAVDEVLQLRSAIPDQRAAMGEQDVLELELL